MREPQEPVARVDEEERGRLVGRVRVFEHLPRERLLEPVDAPVQLDVREPLGVREGQVQLLERVGFRVAEAAHHRGGAAQVLAREQQVDVACVPQSDVPVGALGETGALERERADAGGAQRPGDALRGRLERQPGGAVAGVRRGDLPRERGRHVGHPGQPPAEQREHAGALQVAGEQCEVAARRQLADARRVRLA